MESEKSAAGAGVSNPASPRPRWRRGVATVSLFEEVDGFWREFDDAPRWILLLEERLELRAEIYVLHVAQLGHIFLQMCIDLVYPHRWIYDDRRDSPSDLVH